MVKNTIRNGVIKNNKKDIDSIGEFETGSIPECPIAAFVIAQGGK